MNYRFEYYPNPEFVELHVNKSLTDSACTIRREMYGQPVTEEDSMFLAMLAGAEGVGASAISGISFNRYSVHIPRASAFSREEVVKNVLEVVVMVLRMRGVLAENEELVKLPDIRTDARYIKCPECARLEEAEMKGLGAEIWDNE